MQELPSPENPSLHSQVYEPKELSHLAFLSHGLEIHSLMSKIFMENLIIFEAIKHYIVDLKLKFSKTKWTAKFCFIIKIMNHHADYTCT